MSVCVVLFEEEQTTQWPSEKVQKDKRATTHTHKTKVRVTDPLRRYILLNQFW
jgi:hypothetical protein